MRITKSSTFFILSTQYINYINMKFILQSFSETHKDNINTPVEIGA